MLYMSNSYTHNYMNSLILVNLVENKTRELKFTCNIEVKSTFEVPSFMSPRKINKFNSDELVIYSSY